MPGKTGPNAVTKTITKTSRKPSRKPPENLPKTSRKPHEFFWVVRVMGKEIFLRCPKNGPQKIFQSVFRSVFRAFSGALLERLENFFRAFSEQRFWFKQLIAMGSITHEVKRLIWQNFSFKDVWFPHAWGTESWHIIMEKNKHVLQRKQNIVRAILAWMRLPRPVQTCRPPEMISRLRKQASREINRHVCAPEGTANWKSRNAISVNPMLGTPTITLQKTRICHI